MGGTKLLANTDIETQPGVSRIDFLEEQRFSPNHIQAETMPRQISRYQGGTGEREVTAPGRRQSA
jgi:hypothetical protein